MVLFLKCNICQTMVHIEEIKSHKITKKHKSRIQLLDIIESCGTKSGNPNSKIIISDCGLI